MYQYWQRQSDQRFYEILLTQDLLGDWLICLAWGSRYKKTVKGKTLIFKSLQGALEHLPKLEKRRKQHRYQLKNEH